MGVQARGGKRAYRNPFKNRRFLPCQIPGGVSRGVGVIYGHFSGFFGWPGWPGWPVAGLGGFWVVGVISVSFGVGVWGLCGVNRCWC